MNNDPCAGCGHYRALQECVSSGMKVCHYILDTGSARGCAFGEGCDKYDAEYRHDRYAHFRNFRII